MISSRKHNLARINDKYLLNCIYGQLFLSFYKAISKKRLPAEKSHNSILLYFSVFSKKIRVS